MSIRGNTIPIILYYHPNVRDEDLAGTIRANMIDFKGTVNVATKIHRFGIYNQNSKVIYITTYGNTANFLVSIKRALAGVEFQTLENNGSHITNYVLGLLPLQSDKISSGTKRNK